MHKRLRDRLLTFAWDGVKGIVYKRTVKEAYTKKQGGKRGRRVGLKFENTGVDEDVPVRVVCVSSVLGTVVNCL